VIALSTGEIVTLIGAVTAAIVSIIGAFRVGGVKSDVAAVKSDVADSAAAVADVKAGIDTYNESTLGGLGAARETRRIGDIPPDERTAKEARHIAQIPDPDHPSARGPAEPGYASPLPPPPPPRG
jgi:hypothetical protein